MVFKFSSELVQIHTWILQNPHDDLSKSTRGFCKPLTLVCANGHILLTMPLSVLPRTAQQLPLLRARRADLDVYAPQWTRGLDAAQGIIADVL